MKPLLPLLILLLLPWNILADGPTLERYALVVGSNQGGKGTGILKYAASDAKHFQEVLTRLGGLREENSLLLVNPEKDSLLRGLEFLQNKVKKARSPDHQGQFVFYYSGHSDEKGLLLNGERLDYSELKSKIDAVGSEVQIVILDSCSSGAFTRTKGGQIAAPFLQDLSTEVEGHAFLTSSTAEEVSQESDRIGSSFFTHALVEGLRGAADANGDSKVSLNEAYDYAYGQTLSDTLKTTSGSQHPAFDIKLSGKGNLILTDLRTGGATLTFPVGLGGMLTVRDISNRIVAELSKTSDKVLSLGVEEGYYKILWQAGDSQSELNTIVDEAKEYPISPEAFRPTVRAPSRVRGAGGSELVPNFTGIRIVDPDGIDQFQLNLLLGKSPQLEGVMWSLLANQTVRPSSGFQLAPFTNLAEQDFSGVQWTLGANWTMGDVLGAQVGGLYNGTAGKVAGIQFGAVNYIGQTLNWGQIGVVNLLEGDGRSLQLGVWNRSGGEFTGIQAGPGVNWAQNLTGVQIGLVNYSEKQTGVQVGLINISKELTGFPLGLLDIQFNGQNHIDTTVEFTGTNWETVGKDLATSTFFRFGSEYFYKYFVFSTRMAYSGTNDSLPALSAGAGLGFRIPVLIPGAAIHVDGGTTYNRTDFALDLRQDPLIWHKFVPEGRTFVSWSFYQNFGVMLGWDHHLLTEHFHPPFVTEGKLEIKTDWGNLFLASRLFLGIQI